MTPNAMPLRVTGCPTGVVVGDEALHTH